MLRAMCSQVPGFRKYMNEAHMNGIRFAFFSGRNNIGIDEFDMTAGGEVFTIEPVIEGAKRGDSCRSLLVLLHLLRHSLQLAALWLCGVQHWGQRLRRAQQ